MLASWSAQILVILCLFSAAHESGARVTPVIRRRALLHDGRYALFRKSATTGTRESTSTPKPDYNKETPIAPPIRVPPTQWTKKTKLPITVESIIAIIWIAMVASMPLILMRLEDETNITRVQKIIFATMVIILICGVFLFTEIVVFQSAHFEYERTLTIVESVYFLSQVLTTVGYGDVTPAYPRGQVFVALYVLFSLLIIANVISEVQECVGRHARRFGSELMQRYQQAEKEAEQLKDTIENELGSKSEEALEALERKLSPVHGFDQKSVDSLRRTFFSLDPPPIDFKDSIGGGAQFLFFVVLGCLFFMNHPYENKSTLEAIYMSVITLSTVGFGAVTPQSEAGKVFSSFWMLFGSAALVGLIGALTNLYDQIKARELYFTRDIKQEEQDFFSELPPEMDKFEFMKRCLLFRALIDEKDVKILEDSFEVIGRRSKDGKAYKTNFLEFIAQTEIESQLSLSDLASSLSNFRFGSSHSDISSTGATPRSSDVTPR